MITINFPTSPLQYQTEPKGNKNGAIKANAATKEGYRSNVLVLKNGYYSGKLLFSESEELYPWPPRLYASMFNYSIEKEKRNWELHWQLLSRNMNLTNSGKYWLKYLEGAGSDSQGKLHINVKKLAELPLKWMEM